MANNTIKLTFSSKLPVSQEQAWQWLTSFAGISKEMRPFVQMTTPKGMTHLTAAEITPGKPLLRSWIKLFSVLPIDYSDLTFSQWQDGEGFVENSTMGSMHSWQHERRVSVTENGCVLTDALTFEPKFFAGITKHFVHAFFKHRHRMLKKHLA